ncbi:MAG: heme ABC exporter ATP-binding protein CcmA [Acidobacteria bacterium]|nr:heme ABC exporter ATP-binding protein CcmA [Acidobacteriota bacterium]
MNGETGAEVLLQIKNVRKHFGHFPALRGISFDVAAGDFISIVGPNGAGKSTLLRCIATLQRPTAGTITFRGRDIFDQTADIRRRLGYMSHTLFLYGELTGQENLNFYARLFDVPHPRERGEALLNQLGLFPYRHHTVRTYSRGMRQRLAIARVMLHEPDIFLLDEPFTGLDQHGGQGLLELLHTVKAQGRTILMISHDLDRALEISTRLHIMVQGKIRDTSTIRAGEAPLFRDRYLDVVRRQEKPR